jgi:chorismate mutase
MNELEDLRKEIDAIDNHLLEIIQKRLIIMKQTGEAKKKIGKPVRDEKREQEIISLLEEKAKELGIPIQIIQGIWKVFFEASIDIEK